NTQQAKSELTEAAPQLPEARLLLAQLNLQTGGVQPAIDDLEKLTRSMPGLRDGHRLLGTAYLAGREPAKALEAYRTFASLAPRDAQGPFLVGVALRAQGKRAEAAKQFESALALAPGYAEPLAHLVSFKFEDKDPAGAVEIVKKQIALAPKSGLLHQQRGDTAKAQDVYTKALAINPRFAPAANNLAWIYAHEGGDKEKALQLAQTAKEAAPDDPHISDTLGWILYKRGVYQRAL